MVAQPSWSRHAYRSAAEVQEKSGNFAADAELQREDAGHVQDVAAVGERVATVPPAVGGIGQRHGVAAVDVVLFRCVVDGVRPSVRRKQFIAVGRRL